MFDDELDPRARGAPGIGSGEPWTPRAARPRDDPSPERRTRTRRSMDTDTSTAASPAADLVASAGAAGELDDLMRPPRPEPEVQALVADWFVRTGLDAAIAAARARLAQDRDTHPEPDSRLYTLDMLLTQLEHVRVLDLETLRARFAYARLAARVPPQAWGVPEWVVFLAGFCPRNADTPAPAGAPAGRAIVRVEETEGQLYLYDVARPVLTADRGSTLRACDVVVAHAVHAAAQAAPDDRLLQLARQQLTIGAATLKTAIDNICHLSSPHIPLAVPRPGVFLWSHGSESAPIDVPPALGRGLDVSSYMTAVCCDIYDRRRRAHTSDEARARATELYRECYARYNGFLWTELPRGAVPPAAFVAVQKELLAPPVPFAPDAPPELPEPFLRITTAQEWTDDTRDAFLAAVAHAVLVTPIPRDVLPPDFQTTLLEANLVVIDDQSQTGKSVLIAIISDNVWRPALSVELSEDQFASAGITRAQSLIDLGDQNMTGWGPRKMQETLRWALKYCDNGGFRGRLMRVDTFAPETQVPTWSFGQPRRADVVLTTNARLSLPWEYMRRMMYFTHPTPRTRIEQDTGLVQRMKSAYAALLLRSVHAFHTRMLMRSTGDRNAMWSAQQHAWVGMLLDAQSVIMRFAKDTMVRRRQADMSLGAAKLWILGRSAAVAIDAVFWARFKAWAEKLPPADRPFLQATPQSVRNDLAPTGIELVAGDDGVFFLPFFEWTATALAADEFGFNDRRY